MPGNQLTDTDIAALLYQRGFRDKGLERGISIVLAESGGRIDAKNRNLDGSIDRGIWQINSRWHKEVSDVCAYNPECSTVQAFRISKNGKSFSQWVTFTSGAWIAYQPRAREAMKEIVGKIPEKPRDASDWTSVDLGDVLGEPWKVLNQVLSALLNPAFWIRVVQVGGGAILMLIGALMLFRDYVPAPVMKAGKTLKKARA